MTVILSTGPLGGSAIGVLYAAEFPETSAG